MMEIVMIIAAAGAIIAVLYYIGVYIQITRYSSRIKTLKPGDKIQIEWSKIMGDFGYAHCLNNSPKTKKLLIELEWEDNTRTKLILDYNSEKLSNFDLLNIKIGKWLDLSKLQDKINEALDMEDYEEADRLKKEIDKLSGK